MMQRAHYFRVFLANGKYCRYLLALLCLALLYQLFLTKNAGDEVAGHQMAALMLSRANIGNVESFKDERAMHGLKYFYFQATESDLARVLRLLELKPNSAVPDVFVDRINYAKTSVKWKFNWDTNRVYFTYYCHNNSPGWTVDLVLVDGNNAVYITDGYMPSAVTKRDDYATCAPPG